MQAAEKLADLCWKHLEREESMLSATLEAVREMRTALIGRDQKILAEAQQRQEEVLRARDALRQERERFRREAADLLGISPEAVTLPALAERLSPEAGERLKQGRERLAQMAAEMESLNQNNVTLIYYCLDFLDRFFTDITGREPSSGRYGPSGTQEEASRGSIIEARG